MLYRSLVPRVAGRFLLAYVLLATFWAGGALPSAAGSASTLDLSWLDAPSLFGALADLTHVDVLRHWPGALMRLTNALLGPDDDGRFHRSYALASLVGAILVPLALSALLGARSAADVGLRRPSAAATPILGLAIAAALPLSLGMAFTPVFRAGLAARLEGSPWYLLAVVVGGGGEHVFFHGVLLAWLHPTGRFPSSPRLGAPLVWPGKRTETGRATWRDALRSLAIPRDCVLPCALSAPLFFAIHAGTTGSELVLSLPAGVVFAWLAYRTNGAAVPALVHLSVSLVAALVVGLVALVGL